VSEEDGDYLDVSVDAFLSQVAESAPAPGAGAVVATSVALAAGLTGMSAGLSRRQLADADLLVERAAALRDEVKGLGRRDAEAYAAVLSARARPADDPERPAALQSALERASDVPLEMATLGLDVLGLAVAVARQGNPHLRGDALTACLVAQAAVRAAAVLVQLNLPDPGDPRRVRARELDDTARGTSLPSGDLGE
jgi:formiminotetrahydrofolate cyclodeaminase